MTITEPTIDRAPAVLKGRAPATAQPDATEAGALLTVEMRRANEIAKCTDMIPASYRNKPGAVILATDFARTRGLDLLTVMQGVSFVQGKPIVDATLQRAMAERAGYTVRVTDVSAEAATVTVSIGDEVLGSETFTMADAEAAELTGKGNWKKTPRNMLVARATSNALRWYAPGVLLGVYLEDEVDTVAPDPVAVLTPPIAEPEVEAEPAEPEILDAEVVPEPEPPLIVTGAAEPPPASAVDALKARAKDAGMSQRDLIASGRELAGQHMLVVPASLADIVANTALLDLVDGVIAGRMEQGF